MLVGGLMVHLHAHLAGVGHQRPTNDVDVVVLAGAGSYAQVAAAVEMLGYRPHESARFGDLGRGAPGYRRRERGFIRVGDRAALVHGRDGR